MTVTIRIHVDASACKGMLLRHDTGNVKHLTSKQLWVQGAVQAYSPTTGVIAGSVGASLPARPAAGFFAFIERTASTPRRLQRLVAASRLNSTTESVQDVGPAVFHKESKPPADFRNFNPRQVLREHVRRTVFSRNFWSS